MKNNLTKVYSSLLPAERFKAILAALYRDDEQDAQQLAGSCPRKIYTDFDAAYADRMGASRDIAIFFALEWMIREKELFMFESAKIMWLNTIKSVADGYLMGAQDAALPNIMTREKIILIFEKAVPVSWEPIINELKSRLKATVVAVETFCHNIDIPIEHLLVWFPLAIEWIESRKYDLRDVEPDTEMLRTQLDIYNDFWAKKTRS
jgi:hypothetical protein